MNEEPIKAGRKRPEIKGKVIAVLPEWRNDANTYWKQEVIVETGYQYSNPLKVTFQKDNVSYLDGVQVGDNVIIPYALNGREYNDKYYTDIVGLGLTKIGSAPASASPVLGATATVAIEAWTKKHGEDKAGFAAFCKQLKPGKSSREYTTSDWGDVVNAIERPPEAKEPQSPSMTLEELNW